MNLNEMENEINKIKIKANANDRKENSDKYLKEHAHFQYDFSNNVNFYKVMQAIIHSHKLIPNSSHFSVTSNVKFNDKDKSLEICRRKVYHDYYNNTEYLRDSNLEICNEKIIINKEKGLIMMINDDFKKEGILLSKDNILTKTVKFKKAKNVQELIFLQNIYNYNNIVNTSYFLNHLYNLKGNKKILEEFSYHDYLKNLL